MCLAGRVAAVGMGDAMNTDALIARFCPPLDSSLVLAIASENVGDTSASIQILTELAEATQVQDAAENMESENYEVAVQKKPSIEEIEQKSFEEDPIIALLNSIFPYKPVETLQRALDDAKNDVDMAVDGLLAQDMLESMDIKTNTATGRGLNMDALVSGMRPKKGNRSKNQPNKGKKPITVSLTDQRSAHHIYAERRNISSPQPNKLPSPPLPEEEGLDDAELARRLQNAEKDAVSANERLVGDQQWLLVSSTVSQLSSLLDISTMKIQSIFNQSSFNLHITIPRAIAYAAAQPAAVDAQNAPEFPTVCEMLASITGREVRDIRPVLVATKGEQSAALDLLQLQDVVAASADGISNRPDLLDPTAKLSSDDLSAALYTPTVTEKRSVVAGPAPRWLDSANRSYAHRTAQAAPAPSGSALVSDALRQGQSAVVLPASAQRVELSETAEMELEGTYSSEQCRERVEELRAKRNAALRQAATSARRFRGASAGLSGAASVYAEEARKYDALARRWQMRAASALVDQRRADAVSAGTQEMERIDLHGLTVHEALTVVQHTLRQTTTSTGRTFLEIVTGRGVHSRHNASVIRPAIIRLLNQRGYTVDASTNPGVLYVKHAR